MPDMIKLEAGEGLVPVATYLELLEFVNKGRAAGAADLLDELLPSEPGNPRRCLIANGLNFGCRVEYFLDSLWAMYLPDGMGYERVMAIANALECPARIYSSDLGWGKYVDLTEDNYRDDETIAIVLPEAIGNAAHAFDNGMAFQGYRI